MNGETWYRWGLPCILAILLAWSMVAVSADEVPDLTGEWEAISVDAYTPSDGFSDYTGTQGPFSHYPGWTGLSGEETYYDQTCENDSFLPGVVAPDGKHTLKMRPDPGYRLENWCLTMNSITPCCFQNRS